MDHKFNPPQRGKLSLKGTYSPDKYPRFDTFDAIEISRVKDIPKDYKGPMAVPITFLDCWNRDQFELLGTLNIGSGSSYDFAKPILNGKQKYKRLLIQRR